MDFQQIILVSYLGKGKTSKGKAESHSDPVSTFSEASFRNLC